MVTNFFTIICVLFINNLYAQKISLCAQYIGEGKYELILENRTNKPVKTYVDFTGFGYGAGHYYSTSYFLQLNMIFLNKMPENYDFPIGVEVESNIQYGGKYNNLYDYIESCQLLFNPYEKKVKYVYMYQENRVFPELSSREFEQRIYLELPSTSIRQFLKRKRISHQIFKNILPLKSESFKARIRLRE